MQELGEVRDEHQQEPPSAAELLATTLATEASGKSALGKVSTVATKRSQVKTMSESHKKALAKGRAEGSAVRRYLEAIEHAESRRGNRLTAKNIESRLAVVARDLEGAESLARLQLLQRQMDVEAQLADVQNAADMTDLKEAFVKVAKSYGARKDISYEAWRRFGVPASTLKAAGIRRNQ